MPSYLVECYLPRSRSGELSETATRARSAAEALAAEGARVSYVRSTFLPSDEVFLHTFEADSVDLISEVSRRAGIDPDRVVEAVPVARSEAIGGTPCQHVKR